MVVTAGLEQRSWSSMSDTLKQQVGAAALDHVHSGMKLGIGTGSTADAFIRELAGEVSRGLDIIGVPTSERTAALCEELNIPLTTLEEAIELDLTIDGADEIDPALNLIKGAGGALLREKIVATASKKMLVIADDSKIVSALGAFPLPIEVNEFGLASTKSLIEAVAQKMGLSCSVELRTTSDKKNYVTDGGHLILDASFGLIADPVKLSEQLIAIPGVVETGLFTGLASYAIISGTDGVRTITPE